MPLYIARPARNRSSLSPAASSGTRIRRDGLESARLTVGEQEGADQHGDTRDDEGVREVERRPEPEVEKVGDVTEPDPVDEVREAASSRSPRATGRIGWRPPDLAKNTSIQVTAMAVRTMTPEVAVGKSPNAIPEFWTW